MIVDSGHDVDMKKANRKEYWKAYKAKKRAEKSTKARSVDKVEEKEGMIVDEAVIEVATVDKVDVGGVENRFKRQTCGGCKRVWNSYTLLRECPYCGVATGVVVVDNLPVDRVEMTETDLRFEAENPGYYEYKDGVEKRECAVCEKAFETRLELNRFCGPECKQEMIRSLSTMRGVAA